MTEKQPNQQFKSQPIAEQEIVPGVSQISTLILLNRAIWIKFRDGEKNQTRV